MFVISTSHLFESVRVIVNNHFVCIRLCKFSNFFIHFVWFSYQSFYISSFYNSCFAFLHCHGISAFVGLSVATQLFSKEIRQFSHSQQLAYLNPNNCSNSNSTCLFPEATSDSLLLYIFHIYSYFKYLHLLHVVLLQIII